MKKKRKEILGFTLMEVMVSLALVAVFLTSIGALLAYSHVFRKEASDLNKAVFLASRMMDKIKSIEKDESNQGEFEDHPGMRYEYTIETKEENLGKALAGQSDDLEGDNGSNANEEAYKLQYELLKEFGLYDELATGYDYPLLNYTVTVYYGDNRRYTLKYFRGSNDTVK